MTVTATTSFSTATGTGAATAFPYTFAARNIADVAVYVNGVLQTSGYTVALNADFNGGTVTFTTAPANGAAIRIQSEPSFEQQIDFSNAGPYNPSVVDGVADDGAIRDLRLKRDTDRALKAPIGETPPDLPAAASRAGQYLAFDASGNPVGSAGTGNDSALRTDLAANTGSTLVKWLASWAGAVARTIADKLTDTVSVKDFGALGNSDPTGATGADDTAAIQAAINYIASRKGAIFGGGRLRIPAGYYKTSTYLTLCQNLKIVGDGQYSSMIVNTSAGGGGASLDQNTRNGSALYSNWPSNGSTSANITVKDLGVIFTNAENVGAGFYDNCGAYITLRHFTVKGGKYSVIFDQTELADIYDCNLAPANLSGACVWLVNGADLKAGNVGGFTNRISVKTTQLNAGATVNLIQDDGGYTHTFQDNNYNGGAIQIRIAGASPFQVIGGEFESASSNVVSLNSTTAAGTGVGGASGSFLGGEYTGSTDGNIMINSAGTLSFYGIAFLTPSVTPIKGAANASYLSAVGCISTRSDRALFDSYNTHVFDDRIEMGIRTNLGQSAWTLTNAYTGVFTQCTNATGNAATIPNDTTLPLPVGSIFFLEQTAAGQVSVIAGSGVTITGPLTTAKQGQKLHVRKTAANTWQTSRRFAPPETGWAADTGTAEATAHATYTAGATLTFSATYTQSELTALATRLASVEAALQAATRGQKAIKDGLLNQGIIGA